MIITKSQIKPEHKNTDPFKLHLNDFNISNEASLLWNDIQFIDDKGYTHHLKTRGCTKKRKYRRVKRRSIF